MAHFTLSAGAGFDTITPDEMRDLLKPIEQHGKAMLEREKYTMQRVSQSFQVLAGGTDPGGGYNGSGTILYTVPPGFVASVHLVSVNIGGSTPGGAVTTGSWGLYRNSPQGALFAYAPGMAQPATQVSPAVLTYGTYDSPYLEGGERVVMAAATLTAAANVLVYLQVRLFPNPRNMPTPRDNGVGIEASLDVRV